MADVAFEYKKLFRGAKLEEVYAATLEWLRKKGAKVGHLEPPALIEAVYGRTNAEYNWDKELKRTVDVEFVTSKEYVGCSVWQAPVRRTVKRVLESPFQANITWRDWIDECWEFVQAKIGPAEKPKGAPMRIPTAKSAQGKRAPPPPPPPPATARKP